MAIDPLPLSPKANRGGASAGLSALLAFAAVGGGIYYLAHRPERRVVNDDNLAQVAALARLEKDTELLQRAIRERRAILGMTFSEVEQAKGPAHLKQRGYTLSDAHHAKGGIEHWVYALGTDKESGVLFGSNGLVIDTTDVAGKPRSGYTIRQ